MAINIIQSLKKIGTAIASLQSKKMSKTQFNNIMSKYYTILQKADMTAATNWTLQDSGNKVQLYQNELIVSVYGRRSAATGAGNITDQVICTFTIDDERITYIPTYWAALTFISGTVSKGIFKTTSTSNPWSCTVYLTYTHEATTYGRFRFVIPVTIDVTKYDE